ncbi:GntR family transcriptional regulator [Synergistales bacterium]|nr:GntR family transcriptional regulator [Synergistales bacterium]
MSIEKINLCDEAFDHILSIIASQGYEPASKIPSESELVIVLGVSRNTVRAALNRLNALGILEARQGEGYFLKDIDVDVFTNLQLPILLEAYSNLETLTEFRVGVESQGAFLAALKATEEDIAGMDEALNSAKLDMEDNERFALYDMNFHLALAKASRNTMIYRSVEMIKTLYTVWLRGFIRVHGNAESDAFHHKIFNAVRDGDAELAHRFMTEHMTDVLYKVKMDAVKKAAVSAE